MRLRELTIREDPVLSSWIANITLVKNRSGDVTMRLKNGNTYSVKRVGPELYQAWLTSGSKGQFWHNQIKNNYDVVRLL